MTRALPVNDEAAKPLPPPPPQLIFDDGSRVMHEASSVIASAVKIPNPRGNVVSIRDYYEVDRMVAEILQNVPEQESECGGGGSVGGGWRYRVALQFPDELLVDAAHVCWEFETALGGEEAALVFILGDTTYAACCPDAVAAAHLDADILIHYGHACLSAVDNNKVLVLYSFGRQEICVEQCLEDVLQQVKISNVRRLLLLYEVQYHHTIEYLQTALSEQGDLLVVAGQISTSAARRSQTSLSLQQSALCSTGKGQQQLWQQQQQQTDSCWGSKETPVKNAACCSQTTDVNRCEHATAPNEIRTAAPFASQTASDDDSTSSQLNHVVVGGLELPVVNGGWSDYTVLFIGHDCRRQFLNIVLRFLSGSSSSRPASIWTWSPDAKLRTDSISPSFQRVLNRRFYLVQKAKQCRVFGILVAHLTEQTRKLVQSLRNLIDEHELSSYTFVVGKINPAKLANFPEIDCFVLIACPEHSLLSNEREQYPVPIITPGELLMAFGLSDWGTAPYSTHPNDYWATIATMMTTGTTQSDTNEDDSDAPYFSLVTGTYESSSSKQTTQQQLPDLNLETLPGKGALSQYSSAAADFLSRRQYQGLVATDDDETGRAAVPGQTGIASNYSDR